MEKAFVLINSDLGKEESIISSLQKINGIRQARRVYGNYDIVAEISADSTTDLVDIITYKIRHIQGIKYTVTVMTTK